MLNKSLLMALSMRVVMRVLRVVMRFQVRSIAVELGYRLDARRGYKNIRETELLFCGFAT